MADPGKTAKKQRGAAPPVAAGGGGGGGGGGGIGAVPDDALHHVLSFLPAEDAVRTCVLASRWRHLWKYATGLRIGYGDANKPPPMKKLRKFVNHLLLLRKRDSTLDTFKLRINDTRPMGDDFWRCVNLWIRHVVECQVRMLSLEVLECAGYGCLENVRLVSHHLTTLVLAGVTLRDKFLDFSSCPYLEDLEIVYCDISTSKILSESLKRLSITNYTTFRTGPDTLICVPSLVSLRIDTHLQNVPILGRMPSLKDAFVRENDCCCAGENCFACDDDVELDSKCFLLEGLSKAENLALMSQCKRVVFIRDLEWCPAFSNLRILLLNECWCVDPDFDALTCILKHSPVLEQLTLQLFYKGSKHLVEMIGRSNQIESSATLSKHLKLIKVQCEDVDKTVLKVLKFLGTFGIPFLFK
ncbi:hypothetical protein ACP4OV_015030 [Aristida adscensionis]